MSSVPDPVGRPRRRDRFLKPWSRSKSQSTSPAPSTRTAASTSLHAPSSNAQSLNVPSPSISSTNPVTQLRSNAEPPVIIQQSNSSLTPVASQLSTLSISTSQDFVKNALQKLSPRQQEILQPFLTSPTSKVSDKLEQCLTAVTQQQRAWSDKRWTVTFAGRAITLKDEAGKIVRWLDRFKAVGDVAVNADPIHAGLPWAGVRFLLEIGLSYAHQMAALLVGCETAFYMTNRLRVYMDFLAKVPLSQARTNFEAALTSMYAHILAFLASALEKYQQPTFQRVLVALWQPGEIQDFEHECHQLGVQLDIEASNCDRALAEHDRDLLGQFQHSLHQALKDIEQIHTLQATLQRLEKKIDLGRLRIVETAIFDAYKQEHRGCHPQTRIDLLQCIRDWAQQPDGKTIFWLNGMAGTGKSTISLTVARWLAKQSASTKVALGASFFFKRGEGDRGSAALLFPTIASQLAAKIPCFDIFLAEAIDADPHIHSKLLGEQFNKLIREPLQHIGPDPHHLTYVVVVDALDECENEVDIRTILQLWSSLPLIQCPRLLLFLTSRPEVPIRLGFTKMSTDIHRDLVLHQVPRPVIEHDILAFLKDAFSEIRDEYNLEPPGDRLSEDWPGPQTLQVLADVAVPLFIVAATMFRFVRNSDRPREALDTMLQSQKSGHLSHVANVYLSLLQGMTAHVKDNEEKLRLYDEFRAIVGSIIVLADPLSRDALAALLQIPSETVAIRLRSLHSVLQVPMEGISLVRPLHLSFGEFLTSTQVRDEPFHVSALATHGMLWEKCLQLLSGSCGLKENLCGLRHPGQRRGEVDMGQIEKCLSPAVRYACRHWVYHVRSSASQLCDQDQIHVFLQEHFLHWLEALSLLDRLADAIECIKTLQSSVSQTSDSREVSAFLEDAIRFISMNRFIADLAPLQLYSSAIIFAPQNSVVRKVCGKIPAWIQRYPTTPEFWSLLLQELPGHKETVTGVAFSPDGLVLASASEDKTLRLWRIDTGQEVQEFTGHLGAVRGVSFSPNRDVIASASDDETIRLWSTRTGQQIQVLTGHSSKVNSVVFSSDGSTLASASDDATVRIWNVETGQELKTLQRHIQNDGVLTVAFSPDDSLLASGTPDGIVLIWSTSTGQMLKAFGEHTSVRHTVDEFEDDFGPIRAVAFSSKSPLLASTYGHDVRIWNTNTGEIVQNYKGHTRLVMSVTFSSDSSLLASTSLDETVRIWDMTTGETLQHYTYAHHISAVAFSPDSSLLASAETNGVVRLWNTSTVDQKLQSYNDNFDYIAAVAFSPDGTLLASASYDQMVRLWIVSTGEKLYELEGHKHGVKDVLFSPDGSLLACASRDRIVRLWNVSTGEELYRIDWYSSWDRLCLSFSPDSSLLATNSNDDVVQLWSVGTGKKLYQIREGGQVQKVVFSPDGLLLACISENTKLRLWSLNTREMLHRLEGHSARIARLAFSPDGLLLASMSAAGRIRLWSVTTGQEIRKWETPGGFSRVDFEPDSSTLITDRGRLKINDASDLPAPWDPTVDHYLNFDLDWIQHCGEDLLHLPREYCGKVSAWSGNTLAVGRYGNFVTIFKINYR